MAYDKIITIRARLDRCLAYTTNEEKTGLSNALAYIQNADKTRQLVSAINCDAGNPIADMMATKRRWGKLSGVQGYHIVHSCAPGELTAQEAHDAGVEFARRLLGERYEVVIATHLDHLHCHIVLYRQEGGSDEEVRRSCCDRNDHGSSARDRQECR